MGSLEDRGSSEDVNRHREYGEENEDQSTKLRRDLRSTVEDWKLDHYARQYGERKLTLASAARHAGVSVWEFQEFTRTHRIPAQ